MEKKMNSNTSKVDQIRKSLLHFENSFKTNSNNYGVVINIQSRERATTLCHSKRKNGISKPSPQGLDPPQKTQRSQEEAEEFSKRILQHKETSVLNENFKDKLNSTLLSFTYNKEKANLIKALNKMQSYGRQLRELRRNNNDLSLSCTDIKNSLNNELRPNKSQSANSLSMPSMKDVYLNISKITLSDALTQWAESIDVFEEEKTQTTTCTEGSFTSEELLIYYRGISEGTITDEDSPPASARYKTEP